MKRIQIVAALLTMCTGLVQGPHALAAPEGTNVAWTIRRATWTNSLAPVIGGREALPTRELLVGGYDQALGSAVVLNRLAPLSWSIRSGQAQFAVGVAAADTSGDFSCFFSDPDNGDLCVSNEAPLTFPWSAGSELTA